MQVSTSIIDRNGPILDQALAHALLFRSNILSAGDESHSFEVEAAPESAETESVEAESGADDSDAGLKDAARDGQEYVRQRLREELKREPTEEEMDEWLREHTEGY
jgi:hypothetical protein